MDMSFDRADVEAVGNGKPWTHREEFAAEVDTEHMADTASIFARAAHEARSAGDLAERATRMGQQAGAHHDGAAFVEDDRIDITAAGLQGNGEGIDNVVRMVVRAMNRAMQARDEVDAQIDGAGGVSGMQPILERNVARAAAAWRSAQEFFAAQQAPAQQVFPSVQLPNAFGGARAPVFDFDGVEYQGVPSGGGWAPPANLPADIRDAYLNMTADDAYWADNEITDAIRQYRQKLAEYGAELEEAGFDTSQGPLGIWRSPEMAAFNGEEFGKLIGQSSPDAELLARYSAGLNSIAEDGQGPHGAKPPTPEQQAYLNAFFGTLDTDDLLKAGQLFGPRYEQAQRYLANGVIAASTGPEPLDDIREFVKERLTAHQSEGAFGVRQQAERFDDFGDLMSHATLTPSKEFSTALINASLNAQEDFQYQRMAFGADPLEGSPQLLSLAAKNDAAAAEFLSDENRIGRLFDAAPTASWADNGAAVGDLIRSGTLPDGPTLTQGEAFKRTARDTLMRFVSDNSDAIIQGQYDIPARAELTLADVVGHPENLRAMQAEDGVYPPPSQQNIFSVLMNGEAETAAHFTSHVDAYIEEEAGRVFRQAEGTGDDHTEMRMLGKLSGAVSNAALDTLHRVEQRGDELSADTYDIFKGVLGVVGEAPGPWGAIAGVTSGLADLPGVEPEATAERNDNLRRYWEENRGGAEQLNRIYDAARDARYRGMHEGEAARVIPQTHGDWDLSPEQWDAIGSHRDPNRRHALERALGELGDEFLEGRAGMLGWDEVRNDFDEDEADRLLREYRESLRGRQ
ncbi:hypothetical protein [Streptomyces hoynatensis]|uniref:Uncharacterized protein n=1 Tax=Streptomyces hoynatensis TaxID=1141874 RepID=A0A3A9Z420_9ACTN|nr:hypothetical protein [Streptomyces hoynatensis]RKN43033.1 hypothetical protein D7294_11015 [Streptomyces hoynatensis]